LCYEIFAEELPAGYVKTEPQRSIGKVCVFYVKEAVLPGKRPQDLFFTVYEDGSWGFSFEYCDLTAGYFWWDEDEIRLIKEMAIQIAENLPDDLKAMGFVIFSKDTVIAAWRSALAGE